MIKAIKINPQDNMIVALENLKKGETVKLEQQQITLLEDIQQKHKFTKESVKKRRHTNHVWCQSRACQSRYS